ncbi:hypothetical protein BDN71DRAFT_1428686 [Pleurotus eryngii]|uniref:Uncharacterized protein n=1 Tax=Pleurotus eryngii TaxID=5323 RepID=A0A9P6A259_PLEER|nr:hypothetical protein BDN71DRAFT_1428686 [Pleurotus eryngii]
MSDEFRISFCSDASFTLAGVEFSRECFCGYAVQSSGAPTALREYNYAITLNPAAVLGVSTSSQADRLLRAPLKLSLQTGNTKGATQTATNEFCFAGLEFGDECFCGNSIGSFHQLTEMKITARSESTTHGTPALPISLWQPIGGHYHSRLIHVFATTWAVPG